MSLSHVLELSPEEWAESIVDIAADAHVVSLEDSMREVVRLVMVQARQQFDTESGPDGLPWEPWRWTTDYPPEPHKTLQHSGLLMQSIVDNGPGHIEVINQRDMEVGTSVVYAGLHDEGATITLGVYLFGKNGGMKRPGDTLTIPRRPIVGWSAETLRLGDQAVASDLYEKVFGHPYGVRAS